ncbi:MAG: S8 family serine peptidase [Cellulosilyticaceae bacterium]
MKNIKKIIGVLAVVVSITSVGFVHNPKPGENLTLTGKGVKIAIIDAGVEINHPDLKDNIVGGYDFIENRPIYKDGDENKGHGTHVTGIVGANGKMQGIATEASLWVYRVLSKNDTILENNIIKAIDAAIKEKVAVINISLKTPIDAPNSKIEQAIARAVSEGITVVKANGNYGPKMWSTMDVAGSEQVISVANSTSIETEPMMTCGEGKNQEVVHLTKLEGSEEFKELTNPKVLWVDKSKLETNILASIKDTILAVEYTEGMDTVSLANEAKKYGAKSIILVESEGVKWVTNPINEVEECIPIATVAFKDASKFHAMIKKDVVLKNEPVKSVYTASSRGPAKGTWSLKPDVSAPGTKILSTVPKRIDPTGYGINTGTSMSAPYVTGAVALIKQAHPTWTPQEVKAALANNATVLKDREGKPYEVLAQGSGEINIEKAVMADTFILPSNISFGMIEDFSKKQTLEQNLNIKNTSEITKQYDVKIELEKNIKGLAIEIPDQVTVSGHETQGVNMKIHIDKDIKERGVIAGRIYFESEQDKKLVPFIVLLAPPNYPLVSSFKVKEDILSPNNDGFLDATHMAYYLPVDVKNLSIIAENLHNQEKTVIAVGENLKSGYFEKSWGGKDLEGKKLKDGLYAISIVASNGAWDTTLSGEEVILLDTAEPSVKISIQNDGMAIKEIEGNILDYGQTKGIIEQINRNQDLNLKPNVVEYSIDNQKSWHPIAIDESGHFKHDFKVGENKEPIHDVIIHAKDAAGNVWIKFLK